MFKLGDWDNASVKEIVTNALRLALLSSDDVRETEGGAHER